MKPKDAIELQKLLAKKVIREGEYPNIKYIAGCDVSFEKNSSYGFAVVTVLGYPDLNVVEVSTNVGKSTMPYIPGLLSFREAPLLIDAFRKLKCTPDIAVYDGQGIAHPRRVGLASHMGIITNIPSIGCAKSLFIGRYEELDKKKGNYSSLVDKDELIGYALYTKDNCRPIFVSIGHKVSLSFARDFILSCVKNHKIPEPTRLAHNYSNELRKKVNI